MTDEEVAEEYISKNPKAKILFSFEEDRIKQVKKAVLYGLVEGRKESIIIRQQTEIQNLKKENAELKLVCDYNCPVHKLATHNTCLTCTAVRNSPHHDLKNVTDEELQKIIKNAESEIEM